MVGFVLAGGAVMRYGTPEQQALHLRATLATDHVWCQLFSEPGAGSGSPIEQAEALGKTVAERAKAAGVETAVFDRGGYRYHGRVKALAEGAREGGLNF